MVNTKEVLDKLTAKLSDEAFLANKGLSNEVGIHIACYEPKDEMIVEGYIEKLKSMDIKANVIICDLYEILLQICDSKKVTDKLPVMEEKKPGKPFKDFVSKFATPEAFIEKMKYEPHQPEEDVLLITGVGKVYPYMRCNVILENIQPEFWDIPVVVLYPGDYTGQELKLFNKFSRNYYRAFNII